MSNKKEMKKAGIIWRIFKWFGLAVLVLLLIASIIFQAPWKVITLLAIVLLACTALPKPLRKYFWLSVGLVVIGLIIWVFLHKYSLDRELAAIEAERAIPPEENAAVIYNELFETLYSDSNQPKFFSKSVFERWHVKEHPETGEWLEQQAGTIKALMQACEKGQCRFKLQVGPLKQIPERYSKMRRCTYLLVSSANNDMAEGRTDTGLEKYLCVIQMANHLYQQPTIMDFLVGMAIEALALECVNIFTVEEDVTEKHLNIIKEGLLPTENNWSNDWSMIRDVELLYERNMDLFFQWLNLEFLYKDSYSKFHDVYLQILARRRGTAIITALRHYKNKHEHLPVSLDEIKSIAPEEIFIDSINGSSFVYKLTEENFTLYSKGKNNIDENGEYNSTWDPNSFEDKVEEDDRLIWSPSNSKAKEESKTDKKPKDEQKQ